MLLAVLLMVLAPQLVWSAAARYCGHEAGVSHPGHHSHEHKVEQRSASTAEGPQAPRNAIGMSDLDCGFCHGCVLQDLSSPVMPGSTSRAQSYAHLERVYPELERPEEIERPKWQRAA